MSAETNSQSPAEFWEDRYQADDQVWSGRVNGVLADEVAGSTPGTALDLGCGEGGDALWLAGQGWQVTAVDISSTALARGAAQAEAQGLADRITWEQHDLGQSFPEGEFDLVSAQYFHSPVDLPRDEVLRRAAQAVSPGGTIIVVGHAAPPPWAHNHDDDHGHGGGHGDGHDFEFPTTEEVVAALGVDDAGWTVTRCENAERHATGPKEKSGVLLDSIVVARRAITAS
jgi:long-chain acyl-CoA synthetase